MVGYLRHVLVSLFGLKIQVSSCFCLFEFSRQKAKTRRKKCDNTTHFTCRTFVSYLVSLRIFHILVFFAFLHFAFRLRMRRLITYKNMLATTELVCACAYTSGMRKYENAKTRKSEENTKRRQVLILLYLCFIAFSLFHQEKSKYLTDVMQLYTTNKMCRIFALPLSSLCIFASKR